MLNPDWRVEHSFLDFIMNETSVPTKHRNVRHGWAKACLAILMIMITAGQITDSSVVPLVKSQPFAAASSCTFPPSGLVGWWPGDGNAHDIVGTNDGTLVNSVTFAPGKVGQAFSLNGVNQYINTGSSATFDVLNFTIDAWVHIDPATNVGERRVISRDDVVVVPDSSRQLFVLKSSSPSGSGGADGHAVFAILKGGALAQVSAPAALTAGWHHLAGVRFRSTLALYVDGVLVATTTTSITGTISPLAPLVIGQVSPALNAEFFPGLIDEVEIFDRALSASEIQAVFNADSAGKCKPVANWMFDEGSGTTTYDRSGNGNNGTLVNGPTWVSEVTGTPGDHALSFDGISQYVRVPNSNSLNLTTKLTLATWFKPAVDIRLSDTLFYHLIIRFHGNPADPQWRSGYFIDISQGRLVLGLGFGGGQWNQFGFIGNGFCAGQWYHFAATYDSSLPSNNVKLYWNGILQAQANENRPVANSTLALFINTDPVEVHSSWNPLVNFFHGTIDEPKVFNIALSSTDIASIYGNGGSSCTPGPVGGSGTTGGSVVPVDKLALLAPYIGVASLIVAATFGAILRVKRRKRKSDSFRPVSTFTAG
jgi:hypothetical protein